MKPFFIFSILLLTTLANAQTNLVKNGGFEHETADWRGDAATISPYDKKAGKNSAVINQFVGLEWKAIDQILSIPKNTYAIEYSVWIKTENIEGGKETYNAGLMIAEFTNAADKKISSENIAQIKGTTPWTLYKKIVVVPEKAQRIRIMLALAQTNGSIYFDDVKATALSEEAYTKLNTMETTAAIKTFSNGNFEENLNSWNGAGTISTTDKKEGNLAVEISSKTPEWKSIDQQVDIPEGNKTLELSAWLKAKDILQGKESWNNGMFLLEFTKADNTKAIDDQLVGMISATTDWTLFKKSFSIPEGAKKYRIMIALSNCIGTLLADDIQVRFSNN